MDRTTCFPVAAPSSVTEMNSPYWSKWHTSGVRPGFVPSAMPASANFVSSFASVAFSSMLMPRCCNASAPMRASSLSDMSRESKSRHCFLITPSPVSFDMASMLMVKRVPPMAVPLLSMYLTVPSSRMHATRSASETSPLEKTSVAPCSSIFNVVEIIFPASFISPQARSTGFPPFSLTICSWSASMVARHCNPIRSSIPRAPIRSASLMPLLSSSREYAWAKSGVSTILSVSFMLGLTVGSPEA